MKRLIAVLGILTMAGCIDADMEQFKSYGSAHSVQLYSGGELVREWTSTGKVMSEKNSDGYYFKDSATGELVRVTGDLVITPIQ